MEELKKVESLATQPIINFDQYELLKKQAEEVAVLINNTQLNEENIQECKKKVAEARKATDLLNRKRIDVKKYIEEPYNNFKNQCDEIIGIVKDAENELRKKIKEVETKEREEKENKLKEIWNKRADKYECSKFITFDKWLKPQHLNKSMTLDKCELDMVEFLQTKESEVKAIESMENASEVMSEYVSCLDLTAAITLVNERKKAREEMKEALNEEIYEIRIFSKVELELAKKLFKENGIHFEIR